MDVEVGLVEVVGFVFEVEFVGVAVAAVPGLVLGADVELVIM